MKIDPKIKQELKVKLKQMLTAEKKRVLITSAYNLNQEEINRLLAALPNLKQAQLDFLVDDRIIAGYVIRVGSQITDISLKGQLKSLKNLIYGIDWSIY